MTGLTVVSTICDQAPANVAAINQLYNEIAKNKEFGFKVGNQKIIPLYDVPHLLKGLRNNLVLKDLHFVIKIKKMLTSWKHIIQYYDMNKNQSTGGDRLAPKLTNNHIYPEKMKVSCAAQVFKYFD